MKCLLLAATLVLFTAGSASAQLDGSFTLRADEAGRVNLNLQYGDGHSNHGRTLERAAFSEVTPSGDRITFSLRRAPGSFRFEGRGSMDRAAGFYVFTPNADFVRDLGGLGFRNVEPRDLFVFALDDLTIASVKQLKGLVSNELDTAELVRLINHGAGVRFVQSMTNAGFAKLSSDEYRRARDHGVSAELAREMKALGMPMSLEELVRTRDHGVTPEYVRAMHAAGFKVGAEELVRARDHGVTADFLRRMQSLGYDSLPLDEYIRMRDHGVTPDYVAELRAEGFTELSARDLVRLRDHGITARYVRNAKDAFSGTPTVEQIIRLRNRGGLDPR